MGTALVTDVTSSLDEEFCQQLAAVGHNLVLVVKRGKLLNALAGRLRQIVSVKAEMIVADLSKFEDCERITAHIDQETAPVGLLVNNAGFGLDKPSPDNDLAAELGGLDVMARAVVILNHHTARVMRAYG